MNIDFLFALLLNISSCLILIWYFYDEHKQYRMIKNSKYMVPIYNHTLFITNKKFVIIVLVYVAVITILWLLFFFGQTDMINKHWFAYTPLMFLTTIISSNRINYAIGNDGVYLNNKLIPWENIVLYHLKESDRVDNRFLLEIKTNHQDLRGIIPADSKTRVLDLLQNNIQQL